MLVLSRLAKLAAALLCLALAPPDAAAAAGAAKPGAAKPTGAKEAKGAAGEAPQAGARGAIPWIADDWPRALAEARRRDVLVVVDTWAPW